MGINDFDCGCENCEKGGQIMKKGGDLPSKGPGLQDNDGHGNIPKSRRVMKPGCGNRF